jgi:hypothetical protein
MIVQLFAQGIRFQVKFGRAVEAVVFIILPVFDVSEHPVGVLPAGLNALQNGGTSPFCANAAL